MTMWNQFIKDILLQRAMGADLDCSQQDFGKNHHADDLRVYFSTFYNPIEEKINTHPLCDIIDKRCSWIWI